MVQKEQGPGTPCTEKTHSVTVGESGGEGADKGFCYENTQATQNKLKPGGFSLK